MNKKEVVDIVARSAMRFGAPVAALKIFQHFKPETCDKLFQMISESNLAMLLASVGTAVGGTAILASLLSTIEKQNQEKDLLNVPMGDLEYHRVPKANFIERAETTILNPILNPEMITDKIKNWKKSRLTIKTNQKYVEGQLMKSDFDNTLTNDK